MIQQLQKMPTIIDPLTDLSHPSVIIDRPSPWTPIEVARRPWGEQSAPMMRLMLLSMTTPIPVSLSVDDAVSFVQRSIAGHVQQRLTEEQVQNGDLRLQLYCLSYRHDHQPRENGYHRVRRITTSRLRLAIAAVREHAADFANTHYSLWIDSLIIPKFRRKAHEAEEEDVEDDEHEAYSEEDDYDDGKTEESDDYEDYQWGDRALLPYALCHVVAVPSPYTLHSDALGTETLLGGFDDDTHRAWIRCEHQLASSSRGLILPAAVREPPHWTRSHKLVQSGIHYVKYSGGNMDPDQSLRMLAMLICSGFLGGTRASYRDDVALLREWALSVMFSEWCERDRWSPRPRLPGRTAMPHQEKEVDERRVMHLIRNSAMVQMQCCHTARQQRQQQQKPPTRSSVIALQRFTCPDDYDDKHYIDSSTYNKRYRDERIVHFDPIHHLLRAMLVYRTLTPNDGLQDYLLPNLRSRVLVLTARFAYLDGRHMTAAAAVAAAARSHRGLVCYFLPKWRAVPIVMDVELRRKNGMSVVCGYRIVHAEPVREAMSRVFEFENCEKGSVVVSDVIEKLNEFYYSKVERGLMCVGVAKTSASAWFFRKGRCKNVGIPSVA